jgi:hypothetical protein
MEPIKPEETMNLSRREFIERCQLWIKEINNGELFDTMIYNKKNKELENDPTTCLLHQWVVNSRSKCKHDLVPLTAQCPLCGNPVCPDCMNHMVDQLSRVTGYMAPVSGYNAAKAQEFKDRTRHNIG